MRLLISMIRYIWYDLWRGWAGVPSKYTLSTPLSPLTTDAKILVGAGALLSFPFFLTWDHIHRRAVSKGSPWTMREESRRLPLALFGGPILSIAIFYLAWTSRDSIPAVVPMMAGIPFGLGFIFIFMALLNYLTDAYEIYAASALAATSCARSICGAILPLATGPMYDALGVQWATSLLGIASAVCIAIPVGFCIWGDKLRDGSKFSREVKRKRKIEEAREAREAEKKEREDLEKGDLDGSSGRARMRSMDTDGTLQRFTGSEEKELGI